MSAERSQSDASGLDYHSPQRSFRKALTEPSRQGSLAIGLAAIPSGGLSPLQLFMTSPSPNVPPASSQPTPTTAPRLPKLLSKSHTSAAGLLGRTGSGGLGGSNGLAPIKPVPSVPIGDVPAKRSTHADTLGPAPAAKHTGKAETRRPTGRAISGS